ncbi:MAG: hypothetical protein JXK93_13430 [Sphaerochaetaceae bacterium]|nr:hypothetical protein [Sphaerochaetaceae bacterium]
MTGRFMCKPLAILALLLFIMLVLAGCSSLESIIRSNLEDTPIWVFEPRAARDNIPFVGTGSGADEITARVRSYGSILTQISEYLGKDIANTYIAELSRSDAIGDYNLRITREFVKEGEGEVTVHLYAIADRAILESNRSELLIEIEKTKEEVSLLNASASQALRENRDVSAVQDYLSIISLSASIAGVQGEEIYQEAVDNIFSIAQKIAIVRNSDLAHTFSVQRGTRAIAPKIKGAPLLISIKARDVMNRDYSDTIPVVSDEDGLVRFINTNSSMLQRGTYTVSLDPMAFGIRETALRPADQQYLDALVHASSITVSYQRSYPLGQSMMIALGEYSVRGALLPSRNAERVVDEYLSGYGFSFRSVHDSIQEDDEDFFETITREYRDTEDIVLYGKAGVVAFTQLEHGVSVQVAGESGIYRLSTQTLLASTGMVNSIGRGADEESALEEAFQMYGRVTSSLLKRFLLK